MNLNESYCKPCIYSRIDGHHGIVYCNYMGITGKRRGCPPGAECEKRELGDKRKTIASYVYRGRRTAKSVNCPNCGAAVKSGTCEYCGSVLEVE